MKTLRILALLSIFATPGLSQSWELGSGFNVSQPVGGMTRTMNNAFGMTLSFGRQLKNAPFTLGVEAGFGSYGSNTTQQEYTFDDGTTTETNVVVGNDIINFQLTGKYFLRQNKNVMPYLMGKAGWSWFSTNLTIEDPADQFSCYPVESDILHSDNTYIVSGGAGVKIDFNTFFKKMDNGRFYFDLGVNATQGGKIRYMNSKIDPSQGPPDQDVMGKFLNTQTQVIHEHHVGYVYTSLINMVEYKLGAFCRLGR